MNRERREEVGPLLFPLVSIMLSGWIDEHCKPASATRWRGLLPGRPSSNLPRAAEVKSC
jgi:hypothetical protein